MITLTINGATHELDAPITIAQYLDTLGLAGRYVAVARNGDVLARGTFTSVTLEHGDRVEIVRPVGGG
ncbi:MAG: sulfur carrier protein ThiS [Chloroflexi bacterium]|nr:sulfur carrier protein ThiS [Chloroflexota bacterium]